jgi:hypothetical protein
MTKLEELKVAELSQLTCPDCDRDVDSNGGCFYCADQCETCGGGDCDQSC